MTDEHAPRSTGERPVFLVGMMGVGKSTIGPALASRLGRSFVDTDEEVEREAGRSISQIFEREGEAGFRRRERAAIELAAARSAVVALGGGAIVQAGMADRLEAAGTVVWLDADPGTILARIEDAGSRPLLAGLDAEGRKLRVEALLAERTPYYARASIRVDASVRLEEIVDAIVGSLA